MEIDTQPFEDFNSQAKQAVEHTKQRVLRADDNYFNFLQKTISSYPTVGMELCEKLRSYAEKNIAATNEFLRKVSQAKDFREILRIHSEFVQTDECFSEQTKSVDDTYTKAAKGKIEQPFKTEAFRRCAMSKVSAANHASKASIDGLSRAA